ncbi:unnamed protein product [Moneuplotes crassus]|uniref:Uncharacterized protein n=1 Tax=Euplotes crassus TaxID=5936 RepID=A0AAD1Y5S6_EUPCR|nr:unnamed protein product [Moneuplotes crassus]
MSNTSSRSSKLRVNSLDEGYSKKSHFKKEGDIKKGKILSKLRQLKRKDEHPELKRYKYMTKRQRMVGRNDHMGSLLGIIRSSFDERMSKKLGNDSISPTKSFSKKKRNLNRSIDCDDTSDVSVRQPRCKLKSENMKEYMYMRNTSTFKDCDKKVVDTPKIIRRKVPDVDLRKKTLSNNFMKDKLHSICDGPSIFFPSQIKEDNFEESSTNTNGSFQNSVNKIERKTIIRRRREERNRSLDLTGEERFKEYYKDIISKKEEVNQKLKSCHNRIIDKLKNKMTANGVHKLRNRLEEIVNDSNCSVLLKRKKKIVRRKIFGIESIEACI